MLLISKTCAALGVLEKQVAGVTLRRTKVVVFGSLLVLGSEEVLHKARLPPTCVALVQGAFLRGFVEYYNGLSDGCLGCL